METIFIEDYNEEYDEEQDDFVDNVRESYFIMEQPLDYNFFDEERGKEEK